MAVKKAMYYILHHFPDKNANEVCPVLSAKTEIGLTVTVSRRTVTDSPRCS